ncbi:MAG: heavy-metal-associated protein [Paenibacillus sp.]|jgi:copper chaperone CopZ|nr:heavy-metal-associated protein [Paenibacillus sp.]
MSQATIKVAGMSCRSCIRSIEGALETIGVEGQVNLEQGTVQVRYDETKLQLSDINEVIQNKGYAVIV